MDRQAQRKALFRSKLRESSQNREKRIDSPLVRYNESDQPVCRVCNVILKSESLWPAHQASRKHHEAIENLKATAAGATQAGKVTEKLTELHKPRPSSTLPADFFDNRETKLQKTGTLAIGLDVSESGKTMGRPVNDHLMEMDKNENKLPNKFNQPSNKMDYSEAKLMKGIFHGSSSDKKESIESRTSSKLNQAPMLDNLEIKQVKKALPDGFFDSKEKSENTNLNQFREPSKKFDGLESKQVKGALPEGFFDNKDADLRARGIEPVKVDIKLVKMTVEHSKYTQNYSFPSHEEDWLVLPLGKISNAMKSKKAIAVDCEMVLCEDGTDGVVRVCAVNQDLEVKLDKVVNPNKAIVDYRTEFTGITAKDLEGVTYSLDDVQKSLKKLLSNGTILVGHSLHNDLKVLKIDYPRVIDTSYIFKIKDVPTSYTPSLYNLCKSILGYEIRKEGEPHNCLVDSQAAMKLVLAKMEHGYDEPITIARKIVQNTDLQKLLLHKVPVEVPCQTLQIAFPAQYTVEIEDPKIRGQSYSTFAVFKDAREADTAYTDIDGKESADSMGRPQKQVTLNLNTGQTVSFFVRRMISVSVLNRESKKRSAIDDGIEDSRRQKMCLQECEHVKEIERLKQEIRNREGEVFNLQKILAALTRKHGL